MALFESYERRIDKINGVLAQYGIGSVEECREICKAKGFDPYEIVKGIQPICFENACWAYTVGASLEDLGKGLRSQVGTMFGTREKGPRYLEMAEGYCSKLALNDKDEIIGYEFISLGKMMDAVKKGVDANEALKNATGHYGQWDSAVKYIDPRQE